jgi:hypothetical protein
MERTERAAIPASFDPPADLGRVQSPALIAGVAGLAVTAIGFFVDRPHFFQGWLVAWVAWVSVALGCLGLSMLHHLSRGAWGLMIRRPLEAGARTLPLLAILFLPILAGMPSLYEWANADVVRHDEVLMQKSAYLNTGAFIGRTVVYLAIWILFTVMLSRLSKRQDETADPALFRHMQAWSAIGFLVLALTATFAAIDWLMSLDPHWFSSLYGLWFFAGLGLSGLTFAVVIANWLRQSEPMSAVLRPRHFHDYGKLFFAFTMLWAYLSFSQFLLIWSGNLPEEIPFYIRRAHGGWAVVSALVLFGHFILPFLILLSADVKQRAATLVKIAVWMLFMRWLDIYWNVAPTLQAVHKNGNAWTGIWIDLAALVGIGGVFVWYYVRQLVSRPLLPIHDPFLAEVLAHD